MCYSYLNSYPFCMKCCDIEGRFPRFSVNFDALPFPVTPMAWGYMLDINAARDGPQTGYWQ